MEEEERESDHEKGEDPDAEEKLVGDMKEDALEKSETKDDPVLHQQEETSKEIKVKPSITEKVRHPFCLEERLRSIVLV